MVATVPIQVRAQDAQQNAPQPGAPQSANQQPPPTQAPASAPASQAPSPGTSSSSSSSAPASPSERRFTFGITGSFLGLRQTPNRTFTDDNTTEISTEYQSNGPSDRFGYGVTVQARIVNHWYLDVSGILRRLGYTETTTVSTTTTQYLNGSPYPSTTTTSTSDNTNTRLIDIPFLVRYYGTGKHARSPRWFLEAGGTWRTATDIRTILSSIDASGIETCCTTTPATPKHHSTVGVVVGAGLQAIDEFGIHVIPEFRYTRWEAPVFENLSTTGRLNQIEVDLTIGF